VPDCGSASASGCTIVRGCAAAYSFRSATIQRPPHCGASESEANPRWNGFAPPEGETSLRALTQVVDVRIIMDRNTRRSKGFAYIEMATRESIIPALSLAGQTLMGQSVMVKSSEVRHAMHRHAGGSDH